MAEHIDITELLRSANNSPEMADELYSRVYDELRRIARNQLRNENPAHTLQPTALVNEAYLKLFDQTRVGWKNRNHFFALASRAIRRILVDHARSRLRQKRGGNAQKLPLEFAAHISIAEPDTDFVALDDALARLKVEDPTKFQVVEMRFFGGLNNQEIADVLDVSSRTVERHWRYSKAWLFRELGGDETHG
jgi:RNA polymerase sigma factor (TIGR02999 family)